MSSSRKTRGSWTSMKQWNFPQTDVGTAFANKRRCHQKLQGNQKKKENAEHGLKER